MRVPTWALAGLLLTAGLTLADGPVPRLPQIQKIVTVEHTVVTDKEHPEYAFFLLPSGGGKPVAVKFGPKQPVVFKGTLPGKDQALVAVPVAARNRYATEEEYERDVGELRVEGLIRANETLFSWILIPVGDKRESLAREYKLIKLDAKGGFVLEMKEAKKAETGGSKVPVTPKPPSGGAWFAGVAASLGFVLGGLWLAGRA